MDAHTLAGLVFTAVGRLPARGEKVTADDVTLEVEELDGARIRRSSSRFRAPRARETCATPLPDRKKRQVCN